jgi:branched-chain amino acid transport system ATP-binding protein
MSTKNILLNVNGIEVIYNHVILVLKGVSLQVPEGGIVACWAATARARRPRCAPCPTCWQGERGAVTKGSIELRGERIEKLSPADLVQRGVVQVMEGRHCFAHLTIEENLLTGAYTRKDGKAAIAANAGEGLQLLPAPEDAAHLAGRLHLGRRAADVRHRPRADGQPRSMVLLDEPSMGLAPQIVEEVFEIVKDLNTKRRSPSCWPSRTPTWRCATPTTATSWKRPRRDGRPGQGPARQRGRQGVLPGRGRRRAQELQGRQELQAPQALAGLIPRLPRMSWPC